MVPDSCAPLATGLGNLAAAAETVGDVSVIAQIDVTLQALEQRVAVVVQVAVVNDEGVELVAGLEAAYAAEEAAGRLGGYPEGFGQGEEAAVVALLVAEFADLDGVDHRAEDAEVVAAADVAAEAYGYACFEEGAHGCQSGGEVKVRRGAVGHHDAAAAHEL